MNSIYYQYNPWWDADNPFKDIIERPRVLKKIKPFIINKNICIITGLRRVGKTSILKLIIKDLIDKDIDAKSIFYVSLDDYLLNKKDILEIIDEYRKLHKISVEKKVYLFLDEITYKNNFQQQLKSIYDRQNVKIFASSSNSSILRDKKAFLTGREIIYELLPLDFKEFLSFKNITIKSADNHLLESYFEDFLQTGGMPEYVLQQQREYLQSLIDNIIYKDIISFYNIKNSKAIKELFILLMERAGKQASINKIANILKISPDTSKRYFSMFQETYLIHLIPRYGKTNEKILSPYKIYAPDLGIKNFATGFRDKGSVFENYLYLMIKKSAPEYVYKDGIEIDFFLKKEKILIESKYGAELNDKQKVLFDTFKAKEKIVVKNLHDVDFVRGRVGL